ncbi:hypothetical protein Tco_1489611, partial [Tanacetum coccineum]
MMGCDICHQTFRAARSDVLRTAESDSDGEEEYEIKRNKFVAPIYGPKPAPYLNCNNPTDRSLALQAIINPFWKISVWKKAAFTTKKTDRLGLYQAKELDEEGFDVYFQGGLRSDENFNAQEY